MRTPFSKLVSKTWKLFFSLKIGWVICLSSRTPLFPYIFASNLIYKFQGSNCNITYNGETELDRKVGAGEHMSALTGKRVSNSKKYAVKDHSLLSGHAFSFDDFIVLDYESHKRKTNTSKKNYRDLAIYFFQLVSRRKWAW